MKKTIVLLLVVFMCLSFTACGEGKAYNEAMTLIENGQYAEAKGILETIPEYKDVADYLARYTTIEITPENWETYFTVEQHPVWGENAFGEGELWQIQYRLALRDEYNPYVIEADAAFGFVSKENCYVIEIDGPNFDYTITDELLNEMDADESTVTFKTYNVDEETLNADPEAYKIDPDDVVIDRCEVYEDTDGSWYVYDADKISLTRAQGNIEIFQ